MSPRRHALAAAVAAAILASAAIAGCGQAADPDAPPEIAYGEDVCDQCGMIISDERFAAAAIVSASNGVTGSRVFDDIGELFAYARAHSELTVERWYVHDHDSLAWIDARTATFVRSPGLITPMGHGLAAFADPARASGVASDGGGETLSFDALRKTTTEGPSAPTKEKP